MFNNIFALLATRYWVQSCINRNKLIVVRAFARISKTFIVLLDIVALENIITDVWVYYSQQICDVISL